jgi:integrase
MESLMVAHERRFGRNAQRAPEDHRLLRFVFLNKSESDDPQQWIPYLYRQHWLRKLCAKVGVKKFGFHGIRHLFVSILAANNRPLVEIQQILRHGSITTTARYIHTLDSGNREVLSVLPGLEDRILKREVVGCCIHFPPNRKRLKSALAFKAFGTTVSK